MAIATAQELIGRDEELAQVREFIERIPGGPAALVIEGAPGIGKTELWRNGIDAARRRDYRVLSCRAAEAEVTLSFAALTDLLREVLPEVLPALAPPRRRALEIALLLEEAEVIPPDERALDFALVDAVRSVAQKRPVLIAVDDYQWLDASSRRLLDFLLRRLHDEPVGFLATVRSGDAASGARALERALDPGVTVRLAVGPLSLDAVFRLLQSRIEFALPRPSLIRLHEASGGNPFFALEIGREVKRRGAASSPERIPLPSDLSDLLATRLRRLSPETRRVLLAAAALSQPTLDVLAAFASEHAVADAVDEADAANVARLEGTRIRFEHPLLAAVCYADAQPRQRQTVHRRLAKLVVDEEERARHLALAASGPDPGVAELLEATADRARFRGAVPSAADLSEQALRLTPRTDEEAIRRRTVGAADYAFEAGDSGRAIALLEDALTRPAPGRERAAILRRLASVRAQASGPGDGVALYREALVQAGGDDALEAEIHLELADTLRFTTGLGSAEPHAEAAVRAAERARDDQLLCKALAVFGLIHFKLGRGIDHEVMMRAVALEEGLGLPAPLGTSRPRMWSAKGVLCDQLFWSNDLGAARALTEELWEASHDHEDLYESEHPWYLALIEWRAGNWGRAAELAEASCTLEEQWGHEGLSPVVAWPRALIAAHRGLLGEARAWAREALARAEAAGIQTAQAGHRWVLGFVDLSLGNPQQALEQLRTARELREAAGHGEPGQAWELPDLLDALVAVGRLEEAEAAVAPWAERAQALDRPWALAIAARCHALVLAARGDLDGSLSTFEQALAEHGRTEDPFQFARTLLAHGTTQRRAKRRAAARQTLEQALRLFEQLPAPLWAEKVMGDLGRIGGRKRSSDLTETERRVAELVAEGRSNKEVASALFITRQTVEGHLKRIYSKLDVRSRTELAHRLLSGNGSSSTSG